MKDGSPSRGNAAPPARPAITVEVLRLGLGVIWTLNLIFVVAPQNAFFSGFSSTAAAYAPTSLGGPAMANFGAAHPLFFAWAIAGATGYLSVALLVGLTTRIACGVGIVLSLGLLVAQFGITFQIPGGTDVGPHPLYLLIYGVLLFGGAGRRLSIGSWLRVHGTIDGLRRLVAKPRADFAKAGRPIAATLVLGPWAREPSPADVPPISTDDGNRATVSSSGAAGP